MGGGGREAGERRACAVGPGPGTVRRGPVRAARPASGRRQRPVQARAGEGLDLPLASTTGMSAQRTTSDPPPRGPASIRVPRMLWAHSPAARTEGQRTTPTPPGSPLGDHISDPFLLGRPPPTRATSGRPGCTTASSPPPRTPPRLIHDHYRWAARAHGRPAGGPDGLQLNHSTRAAAGAAQKEPPCRRRRRCRRPKRRQSTFRGPPPQPTPTPPAAPLTPAAAASSSTQSAHARLRR